MKRRRFIQSMLVAGAGLFAYSWQVEPFWLEFVKKKMPIANLPVDLEGKILMQISDLHVGDRFDPQYLLDSFAKAEKYEPDYVVYTGDFVNHGDKNNLEMLQNVLDDTIKGSEATLAVLGNHDYGKRWSEADVADKITDMLTASDIQVLRNEKVSVNELNFIGIDDYWGTNFDAEKAMNNLDNEEANVVLCHNPDVADLDVWNSYKGWILSGHTHGGQCKPPFLPPPLLPVKNREYTSGEFALADGRTLYINRALGHSHQVRFNVRPEITIFELTNRSIT